MLTVHTTRHVGHIPAEQPKLYEPRTYGLDWHPPWHYQSKTGRPHGKCPDFPWVRRDEQTGELSRCWRRVLERYVGERTPLLQIMVEEGVPNVEAKHKAGAFFKLRRLYLKWLATGRA